MKYVALIVFYISLLMNIGCNSNNTTHTQIQSLTWSTVTVLSEENTCIKIDNYDDSSTVEYHYHGTIFIPKPKKTKIDTLRIYFTMAEKDSLFNIIKDIISNPVKPKRECLDFVGDLKLSIYYGGYKEPGSYSQSAEYSGVCDWDSLSDKTIQLHRILKRKIKWWQK